MDMKTKFNNVKIIESPVFLHHLTFLQNIINRMGSNSFIIKTLAISFIGIVFSFVSTPSYIYMIIGIFIILMLSFLDSYYLRLERFFRRSYLQLIKNIEITPIDKLLIIEVNKEELKEISWYKVFFSTSIIGYYLPLLIIVILFFCDKKMII
ncbi:hypothetical protein [Ignatzschineria cameli]|uniref:hypothetical protein n=1 Tax=Ignatzschineria cameli TaxID=2182793 RepID=UPI000D609B09|nr:hypothetical protein [Ignatzschineria cameli]PWD85351.1 hypothetical protein DC080_06755 [Ignatzschineria cameli]